MNVISSSVSDFVVSVNRGKLTQIFDNLILNSQYWLRESIRRGKQPPGKITIELKSPQVLFSDNGRGIDPAVAGTLFEPFVTTREEAALRTRFSLFVSFLNPREARYGLAIAREVSGSRQYRIRVGSFGDDRWRRATTNSPSNNRAAV